MAIKYSWFLVLTLELSRNLWYFVQEDVKDGGAQAGMVVVDDNRVIGIKPVSCSHPAGKDISSAPEWIFEWEGKQSIVMVHVGINDI